MRVEMNWDDDTIKEIIADLDQMLEERYEVAVNALNKYIITGKITPSFEERGENSPYGGKILVVEPAGTEEAGILIDKLNDLCEQKGMVLNTYDTELRLVDDDIDYELPEDVKEAVRQINYLDTVTKLYLDEGDNGTLEIFINPKKPLSKISLIKELKGIVDDLSLKSAKEIVEEYILGVENEGKVAEEYDVSRFKKELDEVFAHKKPITQTMTFIPDELAEVLVNLNDELKTLLERLNVNRNHLNDGLVTCNNGGEIIYTRDAGDTVKELIDRLNDIAAILNINFFMDEDKVCKHHFRLRGLENQSWTYSKLIDELRKTGMSHDEARGLAEMYTYQRDHSVPLFNPIVNGPVNVNVTTAEERETGPTNDPLREVTKRMLQNTLLPHSTTSGTAKLRQIKTAARWSI